MLEFVPFKEVSESVRTAIWNSGFSDYLVPINMTAEALNNRLTSLNLSEQDSFVVFENKIPKGITLFGFKKLADKKIAWVGGLAVAPEFRKEGIGVAMLNYCEKLGEQLGIDLLTLEVIVGNDKALNLYQNQSYEIARKVSFLKGELENHFQGDSKLTLEPSESLTDELDLTIPWQNRLFHGYEGYKIFDGEKEIGQVVCQKQGDVLSIFQLKLPKEMISSFLVTCATDLSVDKIVGVNLLSSSEEVSGLKEQGISVALDQYQLEKAL